MNAMNTIEIDGYKPNTTSREAFKTVRMVSIENGTASVIVGGKRRVLRSEQDAKRRVYKHLRNLRIKAAKAAYGVSSVPTTQLTVLGPRSEEQDDTLSA